MPKYVIGPDVAIYLAEHGTIIAEEHQLLAPTLLRSQMLSLLYRSVRAGEITRKEAERRLDYVRYGSDCSETAFFIRSPGRPPSSSAGRTH